MGDLTRDFSRKEFACKDGCGLDKIDPALVDILQQSRTAVGISYPINAGCRCEKHNREVGGKEHSAHLLFTDGFCHAADLECSNSHEMYIMLWDLIRRFKRLEIGKKIYKDGKITMWIHVDNRRDLPQEVVVVEAKEV